VQVEVLVDDRGQVVDAEVIRSVPPGVFEAQALEIARSREYDPGAPGRRTEMVDFTLESGDQ
jgi:TonB family protein